MSNPGTKTGTETGTGGGGGGKAGGGGGGGNGGETGREEFQMCENCMGKLQQIIRKAKEKFYSKNESPAVNQDAREKSSKLPTNSNRNSEKADNNNDGDTSNNDNGKGKPNGNMTTSDEIEKFFESLPYCVPICDHCKTQYNFSVMQLPVDMIKSE